MRGCDETPTHLREEGFSLRDAGLTIARAMGAIGLTALLVDWVGAAGILAFPALLFVFWRDLNREPVAQEEVPWLPEVPENQWLDDAFASRQRGAGISTLAVRYGVEPDWLEAELSRFTPTPRV